MGQISHISHMSNIFAYIIYPKSVIGNDMLLIDLSAISCWSEHT